MSGKASHPLTGAGGHIPPPRWTSNSAMRSNLSLYMLLATIVAIGFLFYRVIEPFIFALLFSTVLAVLFRPMYDWMVAKLKGRRKAAAWLTTLGVLLLLLVPLGGALMMAGVQMIDLTHNVILLMQEKDESNLTENFRRFKETPFAQAVDSFYRDLSPASQARVRKIGERASEGVLQSVYDNTVGMVGDIVNALIGFVVTAMGLYYLLVDGETIQRRAKELIPLDDAVEDALIFDFGRVCRGVIMGTVVAAFAQALLAGLGFMVVGVPNVLLLMTVTMVFAFIPFLGAGTIVALVSAWVAFDGRYMAAGLLLAYGMGVVSSIDNLIRAYVIGNEAEMNPLIAFVTVIGAVQLIGLWGVFVGPLIAALFYTLLKLLQRRMSYESMIQSKAMTG